MPLFQILEMLEKDRLWEKEGTLSRNDFLVMEGDLNTNLYLIKKGTLRIFVLDELEENTIRFGYKGNLITALDSFVTDKPSEMYIQALKKTSFLQLSKERFMDWVHRSSENQQLWLQLLHNFVFQQIERERDILTSSPVKRYQRVLKRSPQLFQEIPAKYIADYLRMSPETLSRIKKEKGNQKS